MKISSQKVLAFFIGSLMIASFSGCDIVSSITDSFKKDKKTSKPAVEAAKTTTSETKSNNNTAPLSGNVLARVGKWSITIEQFNDRLNALKEVVPDFDPTTKENKALVLEELVRQQLLVEDAEQSGIAQEKDIKEAVEEFRRTMIVREVARRLTEKIEVTEEEAKAFYEQNKAQLVEPLQVRAREIVVDTEEKAKELLGQILAGTDFAEIAKANSKGKTAAAGGDLGFLTEEPFPQMANALLSLEVGGVSSVIKGPDGFYIVKLEEKKGGEPLAYETIKEEIIQNQKLLKQQQAILDYLKKLEEKFPVQKNDALLGG